MLTNHHLAQSDIDVKSWLSLEVQSLGDGTFSSKKWTSVIKNSEERNSEERSWLVGHKCKRKTIMDLRPIPGGHQPWYYANQNALLQLSLFVYNKKGNL